MSGVVNTVVDFLRANPSLLIFAALSGGYALGKVKFGSFSLGSTTSVLLVAIVLGAGILGNTQYDLGLIKTISFGFFIYAIGYRVGPDFVGGLKRGGMQYVVISVFFCVVVLAAVIVIAKVFSLNQGYAGGLLGGAMTQSSVIGTADGAISRLAGSVPTSVMNLKSDVAVAYAVTYVFGTAGLIVLLKFLAKAWKIDLPAEARKAEEEMGSVDDRDTMESFHWERLVTPRAYRIQADGAVGKTVADVEEMFQSFMVIEIVRKGSDVLRDPHDDTVLGKDDTVVVTGYRNRLFKAAEVLGPEVDDQELTSLLGEILGICVTNRKLDGMTASAILKSGGYRCFVMSVTRQGHELPLAPGLRIYTGDIVNVIGDRPDVERMISGVGYAERQSPVTDLVSVGLGLIAGTLVGLLGITVAGIPVTLGVGGGVLVSGIFFGWLRSTRPTWGRIPVPTQWIFTDLGLNLFIACVGISAGPRAFQAIQQSGLSILLAGICLTCVPHILTWLFGLYALKMNPALLLGAMTGAGTCTAALNTVKTDARSPVPVIGYTVPYAIGNVLLTVWGALVVSIIK